MHVADPGSGRGGIRTALYIERNAGLVYGNGTRFLKALSRRVIIQGVSDGAEPDNRSSIAHAAVRRKIDLGPGIDGAGIKIGLGLSCCLPKPKNDRY